jgi:hypothetical protein
METESIETNNIAREYIKSIDGEYTSTFINNKTEYTDNKASRIGNLIKKSLIKNELNYAELCENSEAFFDPVN